MSEDYPERRADARKVFGDSYGRREARKRYVENHEVSWSEANALWPDLPPGSDEAPWGPRPGE